MFKKRVSELTRGKEYDSACEYFQNTLCNDVLMAELEGWTPEKGSLVDKVKEVRKYNNEPPPFEGPIDDEQLPF